MNQNIVPMQVNNNNNNNNNDNDDTTANVIPIELHDHPIVLALNESTTSFIITDPRQAGNPIVYANSSFLTLTGYPIQRVLGRNCRFMQGPDTDPVAISKIRTAVDQGLDISVCLLNYRADGTTFWNQLLISPIILALSTVTNNNDNASTQPPPPQVSFFVGVQVEITNRLAFIKMLEKTYPNFIITDPSLPGNPIVYANERLSETCKMPLSQFIGKSCKFIPQQQHHHHHQTATTTTTTTTTQNENNNNNTKLQQEAIMAQQLHGAIQEGYDLCISLQIRQLDGTLGQEELFITEFRNDAENNDNVDDDGSVDCVVGECQITNLQPDATCMYFQLELLASNTNATNNTAG